MKNIFSTLIIFISLSYLSFGQTSLIASYDFTGNTRDTSGNKHHLTNSGATLTKDRFGNNDYAYHFNGSQYLYGVANSSFSKDKFSYSYWAKPEADNPENARIIAVGPPSTFWHYYCSVVISSSNKIGFIGHKTDGDFSFFESTAKSYSNNQWIQVVNVYNGDSIFMYVDGQLNKKSKINNNVISFSTDKVLQIGAAYYPDAPKVGFVGDIDEIRFYSKALNSSEVKELYNTGFVSISKIEKEINLKLNISPNPSNDIVKIEYKLTGGIQLQGQLLNNIGQEVQSIPVLNGIGDYSINVKDLASGVYYIILKDDKKGITETHKLFIYNNY